MYKSVERITGMKKFKGNIDGKSIDSTTVFIETKMTDANGNRRGFCSLDFNAGKSDVYDRLQANAIPGEYEIEWEVVSSGKRARQVIVDIQPVKSSVTKPLPAA